MKRRRVGLQNHGILGLGELGGGAPGIPYWLNDDFTDTRGAGAADNTPATPGPGQRRTVENDGSITVDNSYLSCTGQTTVNYGDLGLYYTAALARVEGRTIEFRLRRNGNGLLAGIGFANGIALSLAERIHVFQINGSGVDLRSDPTQNGVATLPDMTWAKFKIVLHATGCDYYFNDALVGSGVALATTPLYVCFTDGGLVFDLDYIRGWDQ